MIFVDDGSTDDSASLLRRDVDGWRSCLLQQGNQGSSAARNNALGHLAVNGREREGFIMFLDADDMLAPNALSTAVGKMLTGGLDELFFTGASLFESEVLREQFSNYMTYYERNNSYEGVYSGPEFMSAIWAAGDFRPSPCMQMLRASFLFDNGISFEEGIIHEDNLFTWRCLLEAKRVAYLDEHLYLRRVREGSTMTKPTRAENALGYFRCGMRTFDYSLEVGQLASQQRDPFLAAADLWFSSATDHWQGFDDDERRRTMDLLPARDLFAFHELVVRRAEVRRDRDEAVRLASESAFAAGEQAEHERVLKSPSFRLGRFLSAPVRKLIGR